MSVTFDTSERESSLDSDDAHETPSPPESENTLRQGPSSTTEPGSAMATRKEGLGHGPNDIATCKKSRRARHSMNAASNLTTLQMPRL